LKESHGFHRIDLTQTIEHYLKEIGIEKLSESDTKNFEEK
jgi:hypothetical protein